MSLVMNGRLNSGLVKLSTEMCVAVQSPNSQ